MQNTNLPKCHLLANEVNIKLNMLRTAMMNGVGGEVDGGDVAAVDDRGLRDYRPQSLRSFGPVSVSAATLRLQRWTGLAER